MNERLPEGFSLDLSDPDLPILTGPDGHVAYFGPNFSWPRVVEKAREHGRSPRYRVSAPGWLEGKEFATREEAERHAEGTNGGLRRMGSTLRLRVVKVAS